MNYEIPKKWIHAVNEGNVDQIMDCYCPSACLFATFSAKPIKTMAGIQNYFENFTSREGAGVSLQEESLVLEDWGQEGYGAIGLYEFFYMENGMQVRHPARFSFMVKSDPTQKIQHHHSSLIPDS
ncbi:MAG TPA: hypothetical protein DCW45_06445 [Opitutae bacterium]|nr:hypothetical protein [Opitutae bacterium]|tara:strand:- start:3400 stop:3774 length:375 start_codon:yes stop_codon:yes gene_type:complete